MEEEAEMTKLPSTQHHFVLVHGLCHGSWCWYKVRALLEKSGHKVSCLDLIGAGIDRSDVDQVHTFEAYNKPLADFLSALPEGEKVILVGHSAGGLSVTHAIHNFPSKIETAIYLAATMLRSGFCGPQDFQAGAPNFSEYGNVFELGFGLGHDKPPTSSKIKKEFQRKIFYHLSPVEDSTLASMLLRPGPAGALRTAKFESENEHVDQVKRIYIKSTYDRALKIEQQEGLVKMWPPSEVWALETDHSPFFSAPAQLFGLLIKAAGSASC